MNYKSLFLSLFTLWALTGCSSYEKFRQITEEIDIPSQVIKADYNQTWQAVVQVVKKFDISQQNQEAGFIKTRWIDNTLEVNFTDSFGTADAVKSARFKLVINVVKGYKSGREVTKVTVYKRQLIENDFLQGWKEVPTDGIQEKTILYRIARLITIDNNLKEIDRAKEQEQMKNF